MHNELIDYADASPEVRAVYDDILATRKTDYVNNLWRALAHHPPTLRLTWEAVKQVMGGPGALDPLIRELIYVAISINNSCEYCMASHTAAARAKGVTDEMLNELHGIVALANMTNRLAIGYKVPVDERYK